MGLSSDDFIAIQQLYARYNHSLDSGDPTTFADCFTADGVFAGSAGNATTGTEALRAFAEAFKTNMKGRARHWTNNLVVTPTDGGAAGSCYLALLRPTEEGKPLAIGVTGIYRDDLVKSNDGWKFARRAVTPD